MIHGEFKYSILGHAEKVISNESGEVGQQNVIAFSRSGEAVATADASGTVTIWRVDPHRKAFAWKRRLRQVIPIDEAALVRIDWCTPTQRAVILLPKDTAGVNNIAVSVGRDSEQVIADSTNLRAPSNARMSAFIDDVQCYRGGRLFSVESGSGHTNRVALQPSASICVILPKWGESVTSFKVSPRGDRFAFATPATRFTDRILCVAAMN
jgi:hypothetical protein